MDYNRGEEAKERGQEVMEIDILSVYRVLEHISDGRKKRGVRYSVAQILTLLLLGKLAGMSTPSAIAEWVRLRATWLKQVLVWPRNSFPCASTSSNVLQTLDAAQVNEVLSQLLIRMEASRRCG